MLTGELVCVDPSGWTGRFTTNPGVWVMSQPGAGKSALVKRVCLVYSAYGLMPCVPGDVKGEYSTLIGELGGSVVRIGDGIGRINPLDTGPFKGRVHALPVDRREALLDVLNGRRLETLVALLSTKHGLGRAMKKGTALLMATGMPVAQIGLRPWYAERAMAHLGPQLRDGGGRDHQAGRRARTRSGRRRAVAMSPTRHPGAATCPWACSRTSRTSRPRSRGCPALVKKLTGGTGR